MTERFQLSKFDELTKAIIDASSIIYMKKAGFFDLLSDMVVLCSISEIIKEVGEDVAGIQIINLEKNSLSNDQALIKLTQTKKQPIISEDRQILIQAGRIGMDYYNALMMLLLLYHRGIINNSEYQKMYDQLIGIAHYSDKVIEYGQQVFGLIIMDM